MFRKVYFRKWMTQIFNSILWRHLSRPEGIRRSGSFAYRGYWSCLSLPILHLLVPSVVQRVPPQPLVYKLSFCSGCINPTKTLPSIRIIASKEITPSTIYTILYTRLPLALTVSSTLPHSIWTGNNVAHFFRFLIRTFWWLEHPIFHISFALF